MNSIAVFSMGLAVLALASLLGVGQALAASSPPFVDNGDGTVSDSSTGLMWDQCAAGLSGADCTTGTYAAYTWANAFGLTATQNVANYKGYSDWRLPSVVELMTLVKGTTGPTIDTAAFPSTPSYIFWTSSTLVAPSFAWNVAFNDGFTGYNPKTNLYYVRLVRSGQSFGSFGVFPVGVTGITATAATLTATSATSATRYWLVVPRNALPPSAAQIIAGASYPTVTVVAHGSSAMVGQTPESFALTGLAAGTAYDLYMVAQESSYATTSNVSGPEHFSTVAISTRSIVIDPVTPAKVYSALDGSGVYRSTDSGANWTAATTQPGNLNLKALVIKPGSPATLFAASYGGGVFISTDSAATWAACATQPSNPNLLSLAMDATGRLYAGSEAGVFVSSNDGAAWTAINTGLPP
jgi:hypothetical protein